MVKGSNAPEEVDFGVDLGVNGVVEHFVDFVSVSSQDLLSLHLLGVCQEAVLECELLRGNVNSLDSLDRVEAVIVGKLIKLLEDQELKIGWLNKAKILVVSTVDLCKLLQFFLVDCDDGDQMVELRVHLDADLVHQGCRQIDCLKLLRGDELAVLKLLELLNSLDDLDRAIWIEHAKVADLQPAVFVKNLVGQIRILEVAFHDTVSFDEELTSRVLSSCIGVEILNFSQMHSKAGKHSSNVTSLPVPVSGATNIAGSLCHTQRFEDWCREDDRQKLLDLGLKRSTTRNHDSQPATHDLLHLVEHEWIVENVVENAVVLVVPSLGGNGHLNKSAKWHRQLFDVVVDLFVDLVEEHWIRPNESWSEVLNIFYQIQDVATTVPDSVSENQGRKMTNLLKNVGEWSVGQPHVIRAEVETKKLGANLTRNEVFVRQHHQLRITSSSRCDS